MVDFNKCLPSIHKIHPPPQLKVLSTPLFEENEEFCVENRVGGPGSFVSAQNGEERYMLLMLLLSWLL